jgi:hypothetical protein
VSLVVNVTLPAEVKISETVIIGPNETRVSTYSAHVFLDGRDLRLALWDSHPSAVAAVRAARRELRAWARRVRELTPGA